MGAELIPYLMPLYLGMTLDIRHYTPGIDIFDKEWVDDPIIISAPSVTSLYRVTTSSEEARKALSISGDLALKIKSGQLKIDGKGTFLKNENSIENKVEIITYMLYISEIHEFKSGAKPREGWTAYSQDELGTHYVSTIQYGAELIANLKFVVHNKEDVQDILGSVNAAFGKKDDSEKKATELVAKGKLEKLQEQISGKASLEISYYGTVPIKAVPNTIEGFRKLVLNFAEHVRETEMGRGIPMKVNVVPLENLADNNEAREKFKFLINQVLQNKFTQLEGNMDDLKIAKTDLSSFVKLLPVNLNKQQVEEIGNLLGRISKVLQVYYETIWKMDVTKGQEQLKGALDAYREGDKYLTHNKFTKLVHALKNKLASEVIFEDITGTTFVQWGNDNCTNSESKVLYKGYTASSPESGVGGTYKYTCLPENPTKGYAVDLSSRYRSHLEGLRYTIMEKEWNPFIGKHRLTISGKGMPCAVCHVDDATDSTMLAADENCPATWMEQYSGFLMSARHNSGHTTQYICVDKKPSAPYKVSDASTYKNTLALATVFSKGSLPSDVYPSGRAIKCVVCTIKSSQLIA